MKHFEGALPEESFAIVQEVADRMGISVSRFVSMATIRYALQIKREFSDAFSLNSTVLSREGAEHFTEKDALQTLHSDLPDLTFTDDFDCKSAGSFMLKPEAKALLKVA